MAEIRAPRPKRDASGEVVLRSSGLGNDGVVEVWVGEHKIGLVLHLMTVGHYHVSLGYGWKPGVVLLSQKAAVSWLLKRMATPETWKRWRGDVPGVSRLRDHDGGYAEGWCAFSFDGRSEPNTQFFATWDEAMAWVQTPSDLRTYGHTTKSTTLKEDPR